MIRTRLGLLGLCAVVFGVMAFSATAAQAETGARWLILKTAGGGGGVFTDAEIEARGEKFVGEVELGTASLLSKVLGIKIQILCTAGTLVNALLGANASVKNGAKVRFTGCIALKAGTAEKLAGCFPHSAGQLEKSGIVETNAGHALAELHELTGGVKHDITLILPDVVGGAFVTIEMGELCAVGESLPVFGKLALWDCKEEGKGILTHATVHLGVEFKPLTKLFLISDTAEHLETSLDGSANLTLASGLLWSVDLK
jgi:hypothetical protein